MDYIVVSTSRCLYQEWQLYFLHWSLKVHNQKGKLVILLSDDEDHKNEPTSFHFPEDVTVIDLPDWAKLWDTQNYDWWGGIPNKYESIKWLCSNNYFKDEDRLFFVDPDMIFLKSIELEVDHGEIVGQRWSDVTDIKDFDSIMYPFLITFKTLKKIVNEYCFYSSETRRETGRWESEMYGLSYALRHHAIKETYIDDLAFCNIWKDKDSKEVSKMVHYPNRLISKTGENFWFKQEHTLKVSEYIPIHESRNLLDYSLLSSLTQHRTFYRYHLNIPTDKLFKFYTGDSGYILYEEWKGGFNNIRMSFELAVCISFLTNRTLVIPPKNNFYLLKGSYHLSDFFNFDDLGISFLSYEDFLKKENITSSFYEIKNKSNLIDQELINCVLNFEKVNVPSDFLKGRTELKIDDLISEDDRYVFFDRNLLGTFYQFIYSKEIDKCKSLIAYHIRYKDDIFNKAWLFINFLKDNDYYSIHVRRNDFQYKDLFIPAESLFDNIKKLIPLGSKLYISTDHTDLEYFNVFKDNYDVYFFDDLKYLNTYFDIPYHEIPLIEQLICSRSKLFIGNKLSTFSSYIYRIRGYMVDIRENNYYLNNEDTNSEKNISFLEDKKYIANWSREYPDAWFYDTSSIFVSISSYCDSEIFNTLDNLYKYVSDENRLTVCVHLQDVFDTYTRLKSKEYPNLKIIFTEKNKSKGVVWARNKIRGEFKYETYFLQIDSHTRFKKNWDLILINQYNSIGKDKLILTTYPNHYDVPDAKESYLQLKTNAPLKIKKFLQEESPTDNRMVAENYPAMEDFEVKPNKWVAAGFLFTNNDWVREVTLPEGIFFSGEEDFLTFKSFLKGWDIMLCSEACIWHNYDYKNIITGEPYKERNLNNIIEDRADVLLNDMFFKETHKRSISDLEDYFNVKIKKPHENNNDTIFVALASFIDPDLRNTIISCINQAERPENLRFGVCLQYNDDLETSENCIDDLAEKYSIKIKKYHYKESEGGSWARNQVSYLYGGEKFVLQIDSHVRLAKNWDTVLKKEYYSLSGNPIISYLSPSFFHNKELNIDYNFHHIEDLTMINLPKIESISSEYYPIFQGYTNEISTNNKNRLSPLLYCGFVFSDGKWIIDVRNDPEHYYTGEEFALTLRSYTKGYDIYQPTRIISWHKSYGDHKNHYHIFDNNDEKHNHAMSRLYKLIFGGDLGDYGLGTVRTLEDYEKFAKINIKNRYVYS